MNEKVLVRRYALYGNRDGLTLREEYVIDDSAQERENIVLDVDPDDWDGDTDDFISGITNEILAYHFAGDWDEATSTWIEITTQDKALAKINEEYEEAVDKLSKLFEE